MEINTAADSKIALMTIDRTMAGGKQTHKIRWVALKGCPDGYLVQRITRDTKTTKGTEDVDKLGMPTGKGPNWGRPTVVRAEYYELWEVWKGRVYPSRSVSGGKGVGTHGGIQTVAWLTDKYKDPAAYTGTPAIADPDDVYHDIFTDKVPDCATGHYVKGTNKILGEVFFFPRNDPHLPKFITEYKSIGKRNMVFNTFTGGFLLQVGADKIKAPDKKYLKITRYEAIQFEGSSKTKEIYDRKFPGIMRAKGQGVVNAHGANVTYLAGTCMGPSGLPVSGAADD